MANGWFTCVVENTKNASLVPGAGAGIGLRNVRQRLELLYPQRHRLQVRAEDDTFAVYLALRLPPAAASAPRPVAVGTASSVVETAGQLVATSYP